MTSPVPANGLRIAWRDREAVLLWWKTLKDYLGDDAGEDPQMALDALYEGLLAALDEIERVAAARGWYRDHVSDGFYDAQMWGDPFAISPQLRRALDAVSYTPKETE